jgi:nitrite reductase/ring-hydroxylating ferredoxin subunit
MSERWVVVARAEDLREGRGLRCRVGDDEVALWQVDGCYYALSAVCAHHHVPTLHEGTREGLTIACPLHGWTYSLETGRSVSGNGRVRTYPVKVEKGEILLAVEDDARECR